MLALDQTAPKSVVLAQRLAGTVDTSGLLARPILCGLLRPCIAITRIDQVKQSLDGTINVEHPVEADEITAIKRNGFGGFFFHFR